MRSAWAEAPRVVAAAASAAAALAFGGAPPSPAPEPLPLGYRFASDAERTPSRRAVAQKSWQGGRYTLPDGGSVTVFVSDSLQGGSDGRTWADFLGSLVHGSELSRLAAYFAGPAEVERLCGGPALGCYANNMMISIGTTVDGVTAEEVAAHEYGHHVAHNRANPPWLAVDHGTKRWASHADICARAARGAVFPGDEGDHYELNPGEGFAEAYRVLSERRRGVPESPWTLVDRSFYPDDTALARLHEDVVDPWTGGSRTLVAGRARGTRWTKKLATPLDGDLSVTLKLPPATPASLEVVAPNGQVVARGTWSGAREQIATFQVCGQRSFSLRVTKRGPATRFSIAVVAP